MARRTLRPIARSANIRSEVYERLRRAIVTGELPDGSALVSTDLSAQFGVSRTPVREALVRLVQDGLAVETQTGQVTVRPVMREELESFFEIRIELERFAARKIAERRTEASLQRLRSAEQRVADSVASGATRTRQVELNEEFHRVLCEESGNMLLARVLLDLEVMTARRFLARLYEHGDSMRSVHEHRMIVAAIEAGDAEKAAAEARKHVEQTGRDLVDVFDRMRSEEIQGGGCAV